MCKIVNPTLARERAINVEADLQQLIEDIDRAINEQSQSTIKFLLLGIRNKINGIRRAQIKQVVELLRTEEQA